MPTTIKQWQIEQINGSADSGFKNLIINPNLSINQRAFSGGALTANQYGYDRWRAGSAGCNITANGINWGLDGEITQMIEAPNLQSSFVTFSADSPTADIAVSVGSQSGILQAGNGRVALTLQLTASDNGNILLKLSSANPVNFSKPQLERGKIAKNFEYRQDFIEKWLCQRYFYRYEAVQGGSFLAMRQTKSKWRGMIPTPNNLYKSPAISYNYDANKARIYNYSGSNADINSIILIGKTDIGIMVEYRTSIDLAPSLALFFGFYGVTIDFNAEIA